MSSSGTQGNTRSFDGPLSDDGRYVAFPSDASNLVAGDTNIARDAFVHDRMTGTTERVSVSSAGTQAENERPRCPRTVQGSGPWTRVHACRLRWVAIGGVGWDAFNEAGFRVESVTYSDGHSYWRADVVRATLPDSWATREEAMDAAAAAYDDYERAHGGSG